MGKASWLGEAGPGRTPAPVAPVRGTIETLMAALRDRLSPDDRRFLDTLTGDDRAHVEYVLRTEGPISPVIL